MEPLALLVREARSGVYRHETDLPAKGNNPIYFNYNTLFHVSRHHPCCPDLLSSQTIYTHATNRCLRLNKLCQPTPAKRKRRAEQPSGFSTIAVASTAAPSPRNRVNEPQAIQDSDQQGSCMEARNRQVTEQSNRYGDLTCSSLQSMQMPLFNRASPLNDWMALVVAAQVSVDSDQGTGQTDSCFVKHSRVCSDSSTIAAPSSSTSHGSEQETEDELQRCLDIYRDKVTAQYPVVYIRPEVTVQQLREDRPFLWLTIRTLCCDTGARQEALGLEVRQVLAREMLIEGSRSLDLLLGLLVLAGWCPFFMKQKKSPILTNVVQLALALAYDLGLAKPYPEDPVGIISDGRTPICPKPTAVSTSQRTVEERRAVIGLFLISSV
jgi:hypothetical protein